MINNIHQKKPNDELHHLESFIKCPYKLFYQHILDMKEGQLQWRQVVQLHINWVVQGYFQLPFNKQTTLSLLKLIQQSWRKVSPALFQSNEDYYLVLAKTTDHLLQYVSSGANEKTSLFLNNTLNKNVLELETQLSLTLELVDCTSNTFKIKKYLLEENQDLIELYSNLIAVFSFEAFGLLPEKIEMITLLEGEMFTYIPKEEDIPKGVMYIDYLKTALIQPLGFKKESSLKECLNCPFTEQCMDNNFSASYLAKSTTNKYLH
ncbi:hypothetical protein [Metabacillus litoralis]|uniref:hypothetical protein n=1 Tax=Metabacillus litoralis TaxID=152268 RepID=UPI001CFE40DA|nr:hypothetical protein [Metabacillus litoralis]